MNSAGVAIGTIILFWWGYKFYSRAIERTLGVDPSRPTPAVTKSDGVDYVPARHWTVLFGHHFASIAGAAPIIGPTIAVFLWGWVPALIWIVLGTIFIGGVHDFGSLMVSVRNDGRSIADVAHTVISQRAKILFSSFVWLTLILVIAVFVFFCAETLTVEGRIVIPSLGLIPLALAVGFMLYRVRFNQVLVTISALVVLTGLIVIGSRIPIDLGKQGMVVWSCILLLYSFFASITPVHILLQPRDYLSSFLLLGGIVLGYGGLFISHPPIHLPAYVGWKGNGGNLLWPMLWVTIACGAISGFHSLIASGTTSKQLPNEGDAKRIGYGAMVMEGALAVLALLAISVGFKDTISLSGFLAKGGAGPVGAFGVGFGEITKVILGGFGGLVAITILNGFILTTLDTATRIGRYLTQELFGIKNRFLATLMVILPSGWLGLSGQWSKIWPIFGAANQLVAALALMVITTWLLSHKKLVRYTLLPAVIMLVTTITALVYQIIHYWKSSDYLLVGIAAILVSLAVYMVVEVGRILRRRPSLKVAGREK